VGVRDPSTGGVLPHALPLQDGAVAASGSYERFFDPAQRFHHLVNPASGESPGVAWSVSVTAPTALTADALATAGFVLGPEAGIKLLDTLPDCAGFIVTEGGVQRRSRRWRGLEPRQEEFIA
jgi:thiamine biosynthesis lipoprotein